uniref:Uncharacterized protein n=1 Tax=Lepeophtheirus salmonis TaxID=72036 RepID=A0A0K2UHW3_LEPSM
MFYYDQIFECPLQILSGVCLTTAAGTLVFSISDHITPIGNYYYIQLFFHSKKEGMFFLFFL